MGSKIKSLLNAMRADGIEPKEHGLWHIEREKCPPIISFNRGWATALYRITEGTMHTKGELVMIDHRFELEKHLEFVRTAHGRVLVTGLGLGCVVRGLLAQPDVTDITVIERDISVLKLVAHTLPGSVQIIHADVFGWLTDSTDHFDCAWHDLWSNPDDKEEPLQLSHAKLICNLSNRVQYQGAWAFPRKFKRAYRALQNRRLP